MLFEINYDFLPLAGHFLWAVFVLSTICPVVIALRVFGAEEALESWHNYRLFVISNRSIILAFGHHSKMCSLAFAVVVKRCGGANSGVDHQCRKHRIVCLCSILYKSGSMQSIECHSFLTILNSFMIYQNFNFFNILSLGSSLESSSLKSFIRCCSSAIFSSQKSLSGHWTRRISMVLILPLLFSTLAFGCSDSILLIIILKTFLSLLPS